MYFNCEHQIYLYFSRNIMFHNTISLHTQVSSQKLPKHIQAIFSNNAHKIKMYLSVPNDRIQEK